MQTLHKSSFYVSQTISNRLGTLKVPDSTWSNVSMRTLFQMKNIFQYLLSKC